MGVAVVSESGVGGELPHYEGSRVCRHAPNASGGPRSSCSRIVHRWTCYERHPIHAAQRLPRPSILNRTQGRERYRGETTDYSDNRAPEVQYPWPSSIWTTPSPRGEVHAYGEYGQRHV